MFGKLISILKENPKKIVFTEGTDPRILEASSRLLASTFLAPILIGKKEEVEKVAEESGFNIRGAEIIDPESYEEMDAMAEALYEIRKSKGLTQRKLAELAEIGYGHLARIETGKYSTGIDLLCKIADVLEYKVEFIEK